MPERGVTATILSRSTQRATLSRARDSHRRRHRRGSRTRYHLPAIKAALATQPTLIEDIDASTRAVTARIDGRLVTVWLTEGDDGVWELAIAFKAGFATELKWTHVFGGSDEG